MQADDPKMSKGAQAGQGAPLDELLHRLDELTQRMPSSVRKQTTSHPEAPSTGDGDSVGRERYIEVAEPEILQQLARTLTRVEASQEMILAEFRREITHALGPLAATLERVGELSDSSIQKLRAASGIAALEGMQRRIPTELAEIKASLQRQTDKSIQEQTGRGHPLITLGLGIILFIAGVVAGALMAPFLVPWLHKIAGLMF